MNNENYINKNQLLIVIGKYLVLKYYLEEYYPKFNKVRSKLINVLNKLLIIYYRLQFNIELSAADKISKKELETVNYIYSNYYDDEITDQTFMELFETHISVLNEYDKAVIFLLYEKGTGKKTEIYITYSNVIYK